MFIKYLSMLSRALCSNQNVKYTIILNGNNINFLVSDDNLEKNMFELNICTKYLEEIMIHIEKLEFIKRITYARKSKLLINNSVLLEYLNPKNLYNQEKIRKILEFLKKSFFWLLNKIEPLDIDEKLKLHSIALLKNIQQSIDMILDFLDTLHLNIKFHEAFLKVKETSVVPKKSYINDFELFIEHLDNIILKYKCFSEMVKLMQESLKN